MREKLESFLNDYASATKYIDNVIKPKYKHYNPGIGSFGEDDQVRMVMSYLSESNDDYKNYLLQESYPRDEKKKVDLLIPGKWAIEFKWKSLYYDNGELGIEPLSKTICYPFLNDNGNSVSLAGDFIKLSFSNFTERKAIILINYEKQEMPTKFDINIMLEQFEIIIPKLGQDKYKIGSRYLVQRTGLIHPVHQVLKIFGWELIDV